MKTLNAIVLAALTAAVFTTGCSNDDLDIKVDTNVKVDTGDIKVDIGDINVDLDDIAKDYKKDLFTQMDFIFDTDKNVSEVSTDISVGNITMEYSRDGKTGISLEYTVYADTDEICNEVKSHVNATTETNGSKMEIKLIEDESGENIDKWLKKNIPDCRVEYDMYITVPESVTSFDLKEAVGNLTLCGMNGRFTTCVDVGNITCTDLELTKKSKIECATGNITMSDCLYKADTDITADTGNIILGLPKSGSDGADLKATTAVGDITLKGSGNYSVTDEKNDFTAHSMTVNAENCNIALKTNCGDIITE